MKPPQQPPLQIWVVKGRILLLFAGIYYLRVYIISALHSLWSAQIYYRPRYCTQNQLIIYNTTIADDGGAAMHTA